ncbi:MAG: hypothetical protein R3B96_17220 [Pirellulaceae bacterium]
MIEADAARHLEGIDLRPSFPVKPPRSLVIVVVFFLLAAGLGWLLPDASSQVAEAAEVNGEVVSPETREAIVKELEATLEQTQELGERLDLEEAWNSMTRSARRWRKCGTTNSSNRKTRWLD